MSYINALSLRIAVAVHCGLAAPRRRNQLGQATSEYGIVILVAIALGLAVLALFTGNQFDDVLKGLLKKILSTATSMVKVGG